MQAGVAKDACFLKHDRTIFLKSKSPFPSWTESGRPTLCVLMNCKCEACGSAVLANDGPILHQLDPRIREPHEVEPKCAKGTFHFNVDLTDNLESLMKTCANGPHMGKNMLRKLGLKHERKIVSYLSQFARISPATRPVEPPSFEDFSRRFVSPDSAGIRNLYEAGHCSKLTSHGYSNFDRNVREMQNVEIQKGDTIAIDWTFQAVKNCNSPGAKAMFIANVGRTKEVFALALVANTSVSQKCPTGWLKLFKKEELISNRRFFVMTHAHTTKIFGEGSSEPMSSFDSVYFTFCTGLWTLSTQNVRCTGRASFP
jgi:hypothetical protein